MRDIIGHGGGKSGSSSSFSEAPDSLHSTSYARVLDLVSEGEILGLANGLRSIYLNQTSIQNADGTSNFKGVTVDFRTGTQDQDYIAGFPDVENEVSIGTELKYGTPWVHSIENTQLSAIRITLAVPSLSKADTSNGNIGGYEIDYQIELSTDGGAYAVAISSSFNGKTTSEYQRTARIDLPPATTGWQIRVTRLTPNANSSTISDTTNIVSYTEVIDAKLRYPMSAIVGVQVDATQFRSVPTRAYDLFGRIIQVPSNYDPVAHTYSGVWDGTFKPAWSNNPAWVFRDLILHDRYGLGDRITAAQVDKWALYKIAQYCDQMVPDGKGGTEPRFTCNLYLQTQNQAYAVLQDIASIFRGISYWGAGTIMASSDMPSDPVYVYTAANVIGGKFTRTGSKLSTRYTVALVTWNDPSDFYAQKTEYVEDQDGIARYGIRQVQLTGFGCASQGQAQRAGRWALATSRLETEGISFDVGMDGAIALPGQIVRVADPSRMGRRMGGRIRAVNGRTLTLDKAPTVNVGDTLTAVLPSGVSETHAVASVSGDAVTINADWSTAPMVQSVWSVDSTELSAPLFRVLSVTEKDSTTFTITAVQHEPGKYDYVENGIAITSPPQTGLDLSTQAPPASVSLSGYTVSLNDVQKLALQVGCAPVPGAVAYEGAYRRGNDNWMPLARQPGSTFDVVDVLEGVYVAKLAAVNSAGVVSVETLSAPTQISKDGSSKNAAIILTADAPAFHTDASGTTTSPSSIKFTATLIALDGPVTFSVVGGTLTNVTATTATLAYSDVTAASVVVTAQVTEYGTTFAADARVSKVQDGAAGQNGLQAATARLYQWSIGVPAKPNGSSVYTWATNSNGNYTGSDGWGTSIASNPGTPLLKLYVASVAMTASAGISSSSVSYANASVDAWSQNGAAGANGVQSAAATVYQWAATIPAGPAGSATYTWSSSSFGAAPSGWSLTSGSSPSPGMTLWAAKVVITDSAANSTTSFNWTAASISAVGSAGTSGSAGASYVTAYCASATPTATSAPAATSGKTSLPADNSGGITGTWSATVPALTAGQFLYQSDGIYDPTTNTVTWSTPYWSSLKVGSLSAISANLGQVTAGDININGGVAHIDSTGAATFKQITIQDANGNVLMSSGGAGSIPTSIANAATTANYANVSGRPQDTTNLVNKAIFEDGSVGPWNGNASVASVSGQTFSKAIQWGQRDNNDYTNGFPVVAGETLYVEAWLDGSSATSTVNFGAQFNKADGSVANWIGPATISGGTGWTFAKGQITVPAGAVMAYPWLQIGATSNFGTARAALLRISRYQSGATAGATLGGNVVGPNGETVPSGAALGSVLMALGRDRILPAQTSYCDYAANTSSTGGYAFRFWSGWCGQVGVNNPNATLVKIPGLVIGKTYRMIVRALKVGAPASAQMGLYNSTTGGYPLQVNMLSRLTTSWQTIDLGAFTTNWGANDVVNTFFGLATMSSDGTSNNCVMIDWIAFQSVNAEDGATAGATWGINIGGSGLPANNATVGATFGVDINGQITSATASTYIASAAIGSAQISYITAGQVQAASLSAITATIGTLRTATTGGRMELSDNKQTIYDASNHLLVKIGNLS